MFAKPMELRIDSVAVPGTPGRIGICACPGSRSFGPAVAADLDHDLDTIREWGARGVLTLLEGPELEILDIGHIGAACARRDMWWLHLPVRDMCAPDDGFDACWREKGPGLHALLEAGDRFVVHCWAGLGRAGTVAAKLLVELGVPAMRAIEMVRDARPGAIQSLQQEIYVQRQSVTTPLSPGPR